MDSPNLNEEINLWKKGYMVIGIDEVGRGAFAGPLFVGGVVFTPQEAPERIKYLENLGINDSKKLKPNVRKALSKTIQKESLAYFTGKIDVGVINRVGIGKATAMAMRHVVKSLCENLRLRSLQYDSGQAGQAQEPKIFVLVDGFYIKYLHGIGLKNQKGIIRGDSVSLSIAAASIIAKVTRDNHMRRLSKVFPQYKFGRNKGYGTLLHRKALAEFGKTALHRDDFVESFI